VRRIALFTAAGLLAATITPAAQDLLASRKAFLAARSAVADGRYQEALGLYRKVLEQVPSDPVVHLEYAQLLRDLNVTEQAEAEAREAVRLDGNFAEARRLLGALELSAAEKDPSRLPEAIEQLSIARRLAPSDIATSVSLARALLAADRAAEAAAVLDELPELGNQPMIQRLNAEARARSGRWKEAEAIYRELADADPGDREIAAALIELYEEQDKLDEAIVVLERLQHRDPSNPAISERIVLDLARAGRFAEAEQRARELLARRPENRGGQRLLATVLFERGDTAEGERVLAAAIAGDPDDVTSRRTLASELVRERRFDEGKAAYEAMVAGAGDDPRKAEIRQAAQVELGFIAYLQKDWAEARRVLGPVSLSDGKVNPRAARILLAADRDGEDYKDALTRARAFAAAEPKDPEWAACVAEFEIRAGDAKAGERKLAELAASRDIESMLAAADAWARLKRYETAAEMRGRPAPVFRRTEARFRLPRASSAPATPPRRRRFSWNSSRPGRTTRRRRTTSGTCGPTRESSSSERGSCWRKPSPASRAMRPISTRSAGSTSGSEGSTRRRRTCARRSAASPGTPRSSSTSATSR
jgi:predicted Zn-dependent protease